MLLDEVADVITAWSPPRIDGEVATFARLVVASVEPKRPTRARALLFAASRLGAFCSSIGLELDPTVCFSPPVIERFIACGCRDASPATRRTLRTNLRHLAARARQEPPPLALPRERAKLPYCQAEISSYLALCDAQRTVLREGGRTL